MISYIPVHYELLAAVPDELKTLERSDNWK